MGAEIVKSLILWVLTGVLGATATYFCMKYKKEKKENAALKRGVQCLLRNDIIKEHDKYAEKGYCPIYAKEALSKSYDAYHDLGGNGIVTKLYNDTVALPESLHETKK
jgi:hypothetical protein